MTHRLPAAGSGRARRTRGARVVALAAALVVVLGLSGCGSDIGSDDRPGGDETEPPVAAGDDGEGLSLGEIREMVEARAEESGVADEQINCVLDYLEETFDEGTSGEEASLALDEAFGACTTEPAPQVPLEPVEPESRSG